MTTLREKLQARAERKAYDKSPGEFEGPHNDRHYFKAGHADTHEMIERLEMLADGLTRFNNHHYAPLRAIGEEDADTYAKFQAWLEEG